MSLDLKIFYLFNNLASKNPVFDALIIFFADYLSYFLIIFFLAFLFFSGFQKWKKIKIFLLTFVSMIIARFGIVSLIRFFYHRPRPFEAYDVHVLITNNEFSFPSGHAALFFAMATAVYFYNKKLGLWFFAAAILMGFGRVVSGVHYPSDIIGGAVIGILTSYLIFLAILKNK
ncbi:MAG: phosphatase PAP2 family protein [Patescibacteria group bacterium]